MTPWGKRPHAKRTKSDRRTRGWSVQEFASLTWDDLPARGEDGYNTGDELFDTFFDLNLAKFVDQFGRDPNPDEPVFFDSDKDTPQFRTAEAIQAGMVQDMRSAGVPGHVIYAWEKTGLLLNRVNRHIHTPEQRRAFAAAAAEYREQRSRLLYFDDAKGVLVDNRPIGRWAIYWFPELETRANDYDSLLANLESGIEGIKRFRDFGLELEFDDRDDGPSLFVFSTTDRTVAAKVVEQERLTFHRDFDPPDSDFKDEALAYAVRVTGKARLLISFEVEGEYDADGENEELDEHNAVIQTLAKELGWHPVTGTILTHPTDRGDVTVSMIWLLLPEIPEQSVLDRFRAEIETTVPPLKMFEVSELDPLDF